MPAPTGCWRRWGRQVADGRGRRMAYDPSRHHRRSIRLRGYDYALPGAYFVTICAQGRACLFGEVVGGEMRLSQAGLMIWGVWEGLAGHYPGVALDAFVVMPNHVHGIIVLAAEGAEVVAAMSLSDVVQRFKSFTTARYLQGVVEQGWLPFLGRLWQRNYYEHIIRTETAYQKIRDYIINNPATWADDQLHPENPSKW